MIPLDYQPRCSDEEMQRRAAAFRDLMVRRRTVRDFSNRPVPAQVIEDAVRAAGSAPSGANLQPWHFVVVTDPAVKARIRAAAEAVERQFYADQSKADWLKALEPLGTSASKPFLEIAPYLIAVFERRYGVAADGQRIAHYYPRESVGIAVGLLIAALHQAGVGVLTYTPSPMGFLNDILQRPANERPFVLLVVGHPAENAQVPAITRKPFNEIVTFV
jgi:nitroreductase